MLVKTHSTIWYIFTLSFHWKLFLEWLTPYLFSFYGSWHVPHFSSSSFEYTQHYSLAPLVLSFELVKLRDVWLIHPASPRVRPETEESFHLNTVSKIWLEISVCRRWSSPFSFRMFLLNSTAGICASSELWVLRGFCLCELFSLISFPHRSISVTMLFTYKNAALEM